MLESRIHTQYVESVNVKVRFLLLLLLGFSGQLSFCAEWLRTYDAQPYSDYAQSIDESPDDGWIVATTAGGDGALLKLNSSGNIQWLKTYDVEDINSGTYFHEVHPFEDGYAAAGVYYRDSEADGIILRTDSQGSVLWQKIFEAPGRGAFYSLDPTADGGLIAAGDVELPATGTDFCLVRIDAAGNILWQKALGTYGIDAIEYPAVHQTSDGGFIAAGYTSATSGKWLDAWILKLDSAGNVVWNHTYGSAGSDGASAIRELQNGDFIVGGWMQVQSQVDLWVFRITSRGSMIWQRTLSTARNDGAESVALTRDGGFVIGAHSRSFGPDQEDAWLVRMNATGQLLWQRKYGLQKDDWIESVHVNRDGTIIAAGITKPSQRTFQEAMVFKVNPSGEARFCFPFIETTSAALHISAASRSSLKITNTPLNLNIRDGDLQTLLSPVHTRGGCDQLTSAEPYTTQPDRVITLKGTFTGTTPQNSRITLGKLVLDQIVSWTNTYIFVRLPEQARTAGISFLSEGHKSTPIELYIMPRPPLVFWPLDGPSSGKTRVVITMPDGFDVSSVREIRFGPALASNVSRIASRAIVCTSPAGSGRAPVTITNGERTWTAGEYQYQSTLETSDRPQR